MSASIDGSPPDGRTDAGMDKFGKALLKKLRQIENLERLQRTGGQELNPPQLEKIARKGEIMRQLKTECGLDEKKIELNSVADVPRRSPGLAAGGSSSSKSGDRAGVGANGTSSLVVGKGGSSSGVARKRKRAGIDDCWWEHPTASKRPRQQSVLQRKLETTASVVAILALTTEHEADLNASTAAHVVHSLGMCAGNTSSARAPEDTKWSVLKRIADFSSSMSGKQLCKAVYGLGKLVDDSSIMSPVAVTAQTATAAVSALAADLCGSIASSLPEFSKDIAPSFDSRRTTSKTVFDVRALATILWGLAKLADVYKSEAILLIRLARRMMRAFQEVQSGEVSPTDTAMVVWALAKLRVPLTIEDLFIIRYQVCRVLDDPSAVRTALPSQQGGHLIKPREVSMLVWACASLDAAVRTDELVVALVKASVRCLPEFDPQGLANVLWALGKILRGCGEAGIVGEIGCAADAVILDKKTDLQRALLARIHQHGITGLSSQGLAQVALGMVRILDSGSVLPSLVKTLKANLPEPSRTEGWRIPKISDIGDLARALGMAFHQSRSLYRSEAIIALYRPIERIVTGLHEALEHDTRTLRSVTWQCVGHLEYLACELSRFAACDPSCNGSPTSGLRGAADALWAGVLGSAVTGRAVQIVHDQRNARCEQAISALVNMQPWKTADRKCPTLLVGDSDNMMRSAIQKTGHGQNLQDWDRFCRRAGKASELRMGEVFPPAPNFGTVDGEFYAIVLMRIPTSKDAANLAVRLCAQRLVPGSGSMFLCGHVDEGILALPAVLREFFATVEVEAPPLTTSSVRVVYATNRKCGSIGEDEKASIRKSMKALLKGSSTRATLHTSLFLHPEKQTGVESCPPVASSEEASSNAAGNDDFAVSFVWKAYPGMFAGGALTEMTRFFLNNIDWKAAMVRGTSTKKLCVLDLCCGSGCIGAAVLLRHFRENSGTHLHLDSADADALSLRGCNKNLKGVLKALTSSTAKACQALETSAAPQDSGSTASSAALQFFPSDVFSGIPAGASEGGRKYDLILSNPPVHNGMQTDFSVVTDMLRGAGQRLRKKGVLLVVLQEYIPLRTLLCELQKEGHDGVGAYSSVVARICDGKYAVWELRR